ncbi:MAG: hypothetical protein ABR529_10220 [Actinomycetota bacterium]
MLTRWSKEIRTIVIAVVAAAVTAGAPAMAGAVVSFARNADKVDGKHAVGAAASVAKRKGKLVATSPKTGRLPSSIIGKVLDSDRLDGMDSSRFALKDKLAAQGVINQSSNPLDWSRLKNVPAGLADGVDGSGPTAYAHVKSDGMLISASNVVDVAVLGGGVGTYCFELDMESAPQLIQVTADLVSPNGSLTSSARPFATADPARVDAACSAGFRDALVTFPTGADTTQRTSFFVSFF